MPTREIGVARDATNAPLAGSPGLKYEQNYGVAAESARIKVVLLLYLTLFICSSSTPLDQRHHPNQLPLRVHLINTFQLLFERG